MNILCGIFIIMCKLKVFCLDRYLLCNVFGLNGYV